MDKIFVFLSIFGSVMWCREKKLAVFGAMKTLTYAMSGFEPAQCKRFIDKLGLKSLFPRFMKVK